MKRLFYFSFFVFLLLIVFTGKTNAACTKPTWKLTGNAGGASSATAYLRVTNNCDSATSINLSVSSIPSGWSWQYVGCSSAKSACTKNVASGGSVDVSLQITRPAEANAGKYNYTARATTGSVFSTFTLPYYVDAYKCNNNTHQCSAVAYNTTGASPNLASCQSSCVAPPPPPATCQTCASQGYACGSFINNCGTNLKCGNNGACTNSTYTCSGNRCVAPPPAVTTFGCNASTYTCSPSSTGAYATRLGCESVCIPPPPPPPPVPLPKCGISVLGSFASGGVPTGGICMLNNIIRISLEFLLIAAIVLAILFFIWGGIDWITSGGEKQKLQSARNKLTFAIVGLVVAFLAFFIINFIANFFGVSFFGATIVL